MRYKIIANNLHPSSQLPDLPFNDQRQGLRVEGMWAVSRGLFRLVSSRLWSQFELVSGSRTSHYHPGAEQMVATAPQISNFKSEDSTELH